MKLRTKHLIVFTAVMILPTIFTTVAMHTFAPERVNEIQQMYLMVVFLTTGLLIYWIYRGISVPLAKLQKAARNIRDATYEADECPLCKAGIPLVKPGSRKFDK